MSHRVENPGDGPRTILFFLTQQGIAPLPSRSSVYRALVRHGLISPTPRRRRASDYKRFERPRPMDLWQMDIVGGVRLGDGSTLPILSGLDDHSRYVVSAKIVVRATATRVCEALTIALERYGAPAEILTDNGKVFTGRFGPGSGEVMFDRICREAGVRHILTAPRAPTTIGKVERWHKTLRGEFLTGRVFDSLAHAQAELDAWVRRYNHERPHQGIGDRVPWDRFKLAAQIRSVPPRRSARSELTTRKVTTQGQISFAGQMYGVGSAFAGETVSAELTDGLVQIHHHDVLVATHVQKHSPAKERPALARRARPVHPAPRQATTGQAVIRKVGASGNLSFAGMTYRVAPAHAKRQVQVAIVDDVVEISAGGRVIRTHPIRHQRSREAGAFANPRGRPHRINAA